MGKKQLLLADLVNMDNPAIVMAEVKNIVTLMSRDHDFFSDLDRVFTDIVALYNGSYPGYQKCTTQYHDLRHTTDVLLALARLMHGAHITGVRFSDTEIKLALYGALLHDCGYIQTVEDTNGTGGKYTMTHVERSIGFMSRYFGARRFPKGNYETCRDSISCTNHAGSIEGLNFTSAQAEMLGKMTGSADLIGQFADRIYLEKLLFLYREFREANLGYDSELDLLKKTVGFYEVAKRHLAVNLGNMTRFMKHHFRMRWNLNADPYMESIESNLSYLSVVISQHKSDYRHKLKRGGVLDKLLHEEAREERGRIISPAPGTF